MLRFWVVRHDHNDLYLHYTAAATSRWTRDELSAARFPTEQHALAVILQKFGGKGRAMEIIVPIAVDAALEIRP